ncbi:MAG: hypothetical protein B6D76_17705 [gamma proteobacterium symbiont of Stewartia floridana]|nr:MAG: hypothetical protein B6D76_17705 [gamma proteobacterium symbiont of Stewartia floridana]
MTADKGSDPWGLVPVEMKAFYKGWARVDRWPLQDAVRLISGFPPRGFESEALPKKVERKLAAYVQLAKNCLGESLPWMKQDFDSGDELYVGPNDFILWAKKMGLSVNELLENYVLEAEAGERKAKKNERKPHPNTVARLRCQGIACMLWDDNPGMTITAMSKHQALREYGYGPVLNSTPTPETVHGWIKNQKPGGGKGGRPKKE